MAEIRLPVFEGPLDLLLHLIERDDLDITAVSLVVVTDQYLKAIHNGQGFDPGALAEFVSIGAKLIYLKSRALLPRAPEDAAEMLEDDDVGRELVDLLREYKRFTEVVNLLEQRQAAGMRNYTRMAPAPLPTPGTGLDNVTMDLLTSIMLKVLNRTPKEPRAVIVREAQLLQRFGHTLQRQHADPAQAPLALLPDVGHPAIVALADRDLRFRAVGYALQKEGGPEHLNIHPELIHVLEADLDILALSGLLRRSHLAAELLF